MISIEDLRNAYLEQLIKECRLARLVGIRPESADPSQRAFRLDKLYQELDTRTPIKRKKEVEKQGASEQETETRPLAALEALQQAPQGKMVLLGLPGSGKTTFARILSLRHAQAIRQAPASPRGAFPGWQGEPLLPVIIPLGRLAESLPRDRKSGKAEDIESFITQTLRAHEEAALRPYADHLLQELRQRAGLFLFDGLDEVADLNQRPQVVQAIEAFAERCRQFQPGHRFLVTCRTFSYTDPKWQLAGWQSHELAPFTEEKIEQFVDAWYDESIEVYPGRSDDYNEKRKKLKAALRRGDPRRLWEIADNPLILTLMAVVHTTRGELPDTRALVYEECTRQLLIQWEADRPVLGKSLRTDLRTALGVPEITLNNALQEVAYHAQERQLEGADPRQAALVTEDLLRADLYAAFDSEEKVNIFLSYCESANGLLLWQGVAPLPGAPPDSPPRRVYTFPHPTFQEYLAALYLRRLPNLGEEARRRLDRSDRWREVVMLLGEHVCFREGNHEVMDNILQALAPAEAPQKPDDRDWRALWMAGNLLMLYRRAFPRRAARHEHIPAGLAQLLKSGALTARERAAAGDTLDRLGDPRFDPQAWRLPRSNALVPNSRHPDVLGFVLISKGPFLLGSRRDEADAYTNEYDQHEVSLDDFYLGRAPVTVGQFRAFVEQAQPELQGKPDLEAPSNRPVVNVSWHDALSYCRWLTEELRALGRRRLAEEAGLSEGEKLFWRRLCQENWQAMLPSEAEWEKAARGPLSPAPYPPAYPWGNDFDPDCANTDETGLVRTSAVGCFPKGKGYYELLDLSGNVWEWTRSLFKDYPYDPKDGRENLRAGDKATRVLRGGSFVLDHGLARCAFRVRNRPNFWDYDSGFRVGVFSPICLSGL